MAEEGYAGVNADTPFYRSRAVGVTGVGAVAWPAYRSVLNYDPRANALRGCRVAVEGCMDPSAANYDRHATADSNDCTSAPRYPPSLAAPTQEYSPCAKLQLISASLPSILSSRIHCTHKYK